MERTMILLTVLWLSSSWTVHSARILGIFPVPGRSHYFLGGALMRALAEHGHDITVVSPFGEKDPPKGGSYRDILLTNMTNPLNQNPSGPNMFDVGSKTPWLTIPFLAHFLSDIAEKMLQDENVQDLIKSGERFDAVIVEQFYNDAYKALASYFGGVQIVFTTIGPNYWVNSLVGNPSPVAYVSDLYCVFSPHMTFIQRLQNTLAFILTHFVHHFYLYPKHNSVSRKYIPDAPHIDDYLYNVSLILLNSHSSVSQAVPLVPNMIEIGGFHIKTPKKLPEDLQTFLDSANEGVIYFSMGSNLKSADLPAETRDAIIRTFSKLKQKVLWKWEEEVLPSQPENVKLGKWLPQTSILAHPNVKLFITHGGLLSTTETIYFGIPILAIPVYGDQRFNAQGAVSGGYGLSLPYTDLSEEKLTQKLNELLTNPVYTTNAKLRSKFFHDRQVKPVETALYWIDYVIRHKGAPHLRVAGVDLPWYQYFLVDVVATLFSIAVMVSAISYLLVKKIWQRFCCKQRQKKIKKN